MFSTLNWIVFFNLWREKNKQEKCSEPNLKPDFKSWLIQNADGTFLQKTCELNTAVSLMDPELVWFLVVG